MKRRLLEHLTKIVMAHEQEKASRLESLMLKLNKVEPAIEGATSPTFSNLNPSAAASAKHVATAPPVSASSSAASVPCGRSSGRASGGESSSRARRLEKHVRPAADTSLDECRRAPRRSGTLTIFFTERNGAAPAS